MVLIPIIWCLDKMNFAVPIHCLELVMSAARLTHTCLLIFGYGSGGGEAAPYPCKVKVGTFVR